ncbi:hypothetical protein DSO57_1031282 [Entomophthora muscae]|uniref:Uncharacterized protein n=1 Tax=Entomophthora muscae TaxID=34485 RepID=A0ACC2RFE0_9FUNG|nr:hypothetical protein DSO57_1031282 [Entomophthora muscae]
MRYTNVPAQRVNQAQKGIPKIPVVTAHKYSPVLASEGTDFTEMLGGKIDTAFCSSSSTISYKPSTSLSKSGTQDSGMPTSNQLSTIAKKRSCSNNSKTTSTTLTDKNDEPAPNLADILKTLNKSEMGITPMAVQEDSQGSYIKLPTNLHWEKFPILHFCGPVVMWSTLMLALENPYVISTKRLGVGNNIHWRIPQLKLVRYSQQESLLWEFILLGLAFPYSIGINCVNFLPVNNSPFLSFAFCWLPSVWITYTAIAKVLIQLHLGLKAAVSQ